MHKTNQRKAYTPAEAAGLLAVSEADIQWFMETGQLTPVQICGKSLILAHDLDELLLVYQRILSRGAQNG
jgi:hypothetical protein